MGWSVPPSASVEAQRLCWSTNEEHLHVAVAWRHAATPLVATNDACFISRKTEIRRDSCVRNGEGGPIEPVSASHPFWTSNTEVAEEMVRLFSWSAGSGAGKHPLDRQTLQHRGTGKFRRLHAQCMGIDDYLRARLRRSEERPRCHAAANNRTAGVPAPGLCRSPLNFEPRYHHPDGFATLIVMDLPSFAGIVTTAYW